MSVETKPGADIVADAREWLARHRGRETTHGDGCHRWHDACLIARLVAECERLRMTNAERVAVADAAHAYEYDGDDEECRKMPPPCAAYWRGWDDTEHAGSAARDR